MSKPNYKQGVLDRDHHENDRKYLKGTPCHYHRSKDYEELEPWETRQAKWTGQFRTHYILNDEYGKLGSFTIFYQELFIEK